MDKGPGWPTRSSARANKLVEDFKMHLRAVADNLAKHDRVDSISEKHVDEAYAALARLGLTSRPWYRRPDFETAVGAVLIGGASALPDWVALFAPESLKNALSAGGVVALLVIGASLTAHGWIRASVAKPPGL